VEIAGQREDWPITIFLFENSQVSNCHPIQIMSVHAMKLEISTQNLDFPGKKNTGSCQMALMQCMSGFHFLLFARALD